MIVALKPYPKYKDSGVPWLGEVPEHWDVQRLKSVCTLNPPKSESRPLLQSGFDAVFLPMERVGTDGRLLSQQRRPIAEVWNGFTYFRRNDVIVAKITPCFENGKGACLSELESDIGFGTTEFIVLRARHRVSPKFLHRITTLADFRKLGVESMTGSAGQQRVPVRFVEEFRSPLPPPEEQAAIVRFLEVADWRIQKYIRAKQRLIALLNEQKQAIIQRAVTQGLNPDTPMKPSGIPWLGDIPAHWEIQRTKNVFRLRIQRSGIAHGMELLSVYSAIGVRPRKDLEARGNKASSTDGYWVVKKGDIIVNKLLAWMSAVGVSHFDGVTSPAYDILMPIREISSDYYHELFRTKLYLQQFKRHSRGIMDMRLRLYFDQLGQIPIPVPPPAEQHQIVMGISAATSGLDRTIRTARKEIEYLREYRARLIADVVTGKLDVRAAAESLSDNLPFDLDQSDDASLTPDDDESAIDDEANELEEVEA